MLIVGAGSTVSAQESTVISAEARSEGGLGAGISHMVRSILGETENEQVPNQSQAALMMDAQARAASAPAESTADSGESVYATMAIQTDAPTLPSPEKNPVVLFFEAIGAFILDIFSWN